MSFTSSPLTWEPLQLAVVNRFIFTGYWSTVPVPDRYHPVLNRKDRNQRNNKDLTKSNGRFGQTRTNFRNRNKVRGKKMKVCNNLFSIFLLLPRLMQESGVEGGAWKFIFVFFLQTNGSVTVWEGRGWASREGGQGASSCLGPSVDPPPPPPASWRNLVFRTVRNAALERGKGTIAPWRESWDQERGRGQDSEGRGQPRAETGWRLKQLPFFF